MNLKTKLLMVSLLSLASYTFLATSALADSACIDRTGSDESELSVALGESRLQQLQVANGHSVKSVIVEIKSPLLQSAVEDGLVAISLQRAEQEFLELRLSADYSSPSMKAQDVTIVLKDIDDRVITTIEKKLRVLPVLILPFGYDEVEASVYWMTPEVLHIPVHKNDLRVCFELVTDSKPGSDFRVHVQGARKVLPHNPSNWPLTEAGQFYDHVISTKEPVSVEYREHYTQPSRELRALHLNVALEHSN